MTLAPFYVIRLALEEVKTNKHGGRNQPVRRLTTGVTPRRKAETKKSVLLLSSEETTSNANGLGIFSLADAKEKIRAHTIPTNIRFFQLLFFLLLPPETFKTF